MEEKVMKVDMKPRKGPGRPPKTSFDVTKDINAQQKLSMILRVVQDMSQKTQVVNSNDEIKFLQDRVGDISVDMFNIKMMINELSKKIELAPINDQFKDYGNSLEAYTKMHIEDDLNMKSMIHEINETIKDISSRSFFIAAILILFSIVSITVNYV